MIDKNLERSVRHIADTLTNPEEMQAEWLADRTSGDEEVPEEMSAYDWLENVLDIRYIVNGEGGFISAQVLVAFGGPNIWVNFDTRTVEGFWGGDKATAHFSDNLRIEDTLAELWASR